jgi:SEC-C motif domain protein
MRPRLRNLPCPCHALDNLSDPPDYASCCGRWHEGFSSGDHAPTPQALMRSRYCAYALLQGSGVAARYLRDYLMQTWHPSTAPGDLELTPLRWTGLEILHEATDGDSGVVEFVAHHKVNGRAMKLHEVSRFAKERGAWRYIDGVVAPSDEQG